MLTTTRGLAVLCLLAASITPITASAHHSSSKRSCPPSKPAGTHTMRTGAASAPAIVFGATGGNMVPWSITIAEDGTVTSSGWLKARRAHLTDPSATLSALFKLSDAEGFWSMPGMTQCSGTLPDITSQYIQMSSVSGSKRVSVHGGCVASFAQLLATLENTVDAQR